MPERSLETAFFFSILKRECVRRKVPGIRLQSQNRPINEVEVGKYAHRCSQRIRERFLYTITFRSDFERKYCIALEAHSWSHQVSLRRMLHLKVNCYTLQLVLYYVLRLRLAEWGLPLMIYPRLLFKLLKRNNIAWTFSDVRGSSVAGKLNEIVMELVSTLTNESVADFASSRVASLQSTSYIWNENLASSLFLRGFSTWK